MAGMNCLEQRRYSQSLVIAYNFFTGSCPTYIREFLKPRETTYNLRNRDAMIQSVYNMLFHHNLFTYISLVMCGINSNKPSKVQ